jgi:hypothetical protein
LVKYAWLTLSTQHKVFIHKHIRYMLYTEQQAYNVLLSVTVKELIAMEDHLPKLRMGGGRNCVSKNVSVMNC